MNKQQIVCKIIAQYNSPQTLLHGCTVAEVEWLVNRASKPLMSCDTVLRNAFNYGRLEKQTHE